MLTSPRAFPRYFAKAVDKAFDDVDVDGSGTVSSTEIYCAVLLLYLQITKYLKAAKPPSRRHVYRLVAGIVAQRNGDGAAAAAARRASSPGVLELNRVEFKHMSVILLQEITGRVTVQVLVTFVAAPIVAWRLAIAARWLAAASGAAAALAAAAAQADAPAAVKVAATAATAVDGALDTIVSGAVVALLLPWLIDLVDNASLLIARRGPGRRGTGAAVGIVLICAVGAVFAGIDSVGEGLEKVMAFVEEVREELGV